MLFSLAACDRLQRSPEQELAAIDRVFQSGHLAEAQDQAARALDRVSKQSSAWTPRFLVEDAKIRVYQGENSDAIRLLDRDWPGTPPETTVSIDRLFLLALARSRTGNKPEAKRLVAEAERLCNQSPEAAVKTADIWSIQGIFAFDEHRTEDAMKFFRSSLDAAHRAGNHFLEAQTLINLSAVDLQLNHYEDAIAEAHAAAAIGKKIGAQQTTEIAQGNAGWAYYEIGDYQRALISFEDAAASARSLGSAGDEVVWLNTAGVAEARLGSVDVARKYFDRALVLARSLSNQAAVLQVDQSVADLALHEGSLAEAEQYIGAAEALAGQNGTDYDKQLNQFLRALLLTKRADYSKAQSLLLDIENQKQKFPTIRLDAQHTLAQLYERTGDQKQAKHWFQQSIATYREQRAQLKTDDARLPFFENGRDLYMDYVAFLVRNHRTDDALDVIDQGRAETLAEGLGYENKSDSPRPIPLNELARQSRAVILVYALSSPSSYLWASNGKQSGFYLLPDRSAILAAAADHQRAILAARDLIAEQHPAARTLYDMLVKPAEQLIRPGDRVFIVGAGQLSGLNFETLLTPAPSSHYWIEDVTITHFSSLRFLAMPRRRAPGADPKSSRLLIIGNPVYAGSQYSPLPHAATEVSDVGAHFAAGARTVLTGAGASPEAYIQSDPARFNYIHFVSHATASRLVPLDSAVILSANGAQDSAKLYAREILNKPLNAELVTISACQGSGVRTYAGEGLVGLAWAFLRAGSRNVIGALWDVSDASTPELMQHLYDGIAAGRPPDSSLRAAKLDLLHQRGVFRKPLYWGAFQLYSSGR